MNKRQIEESAKAGTAARQGHGKATPTARQSPGGVPLPATQTGAADATGAILCGIRDELARIRVAVERMAERQMIAATIGGMNKALDALAVKGQ